MSSLCEISFESNLEANGYPGMSIKRLLLLAVLFRSVISGEHISNFPNILSSPLQVMPYLRLELREGVTGDLDNVFVNFFLRQCHCPIIVSTYSIDDMKNELIIPESFAVVSDMEHLAHTVDYFAKADKMFFYIVTDAVDPREVDSIFRKLWYSRGIFRTLILTPDDILFYDPFAFQQDLKQFGKVMPVGERDLYHLFDDMKGYPLRMQLFKSVYSQPVFDDVTNKLIRFERADAVVAETLQERMNFEMILQEPSKDYFGERLPNGSFNGVIGMISRGETDISLTGFFVKDYMAPEIEFTVAVYDDQLCCYVHKAARIPQVIMPVVALRGDFWLGFILSAFACGTVWVVMRCINLWMVNDELNNLHLSNRLRYQFIRIYVDTWVIWVRVNIVKYPPFTSERIFILSICLVSVISGAIIESSLATVYIHPMHYKDVNTLQELYESGLKIIYKYTSFKDDLFFSDTSTVFAALNKKLVRIKDHDSDVMRNVGENGGVASVTRYSSLMLEYINWILTDKVHVVKECPKYYTIAYALHKDSPFADRINALLLRFLNAGLINKWIKDMHAKANIVIMKTQALEESNNFKILTMMDLQLAFYVVILGNVISAVVFAAEFFTKRRMRLQRVAAEFDWRSN